MFDSERLPAMGKHALDGVALITTVGTLLDQLPKIAAGFSIIWMAIQISESAPFKRLVARVRRLLKGGAA